MTLSKTSQHGFTLIELMIVVAIIGILAAVSYSSYSSSVQKSRRAEAKEALLNAAAKQERFAIANSSNLYSAGTDGVPGPVLGGSQSENGYYSLTVSNTQVAGNTCATVGLCFEVRATVAAGGAQAADTDCAVFSIDHLGRKKSYLADGTTETTRCW